MFKSRPNRCFSVILNVLLLLALIVSPVLFTAPASADWGPVRQLVIPSSSNPGIAVSGRNVEVVWTLLMNPAQVHYQRSPDRGRTWYTDVTLSDPGVRSKDAAIAVTGGATHVVYSAGTTATPNIYYRRSLDGGQTWSTGLALTSSNRCFVPKVAAIGNNVYVAWASDAAGSHGMNFRRSTDGGQTWSDAVLLNSVEMSSDVISIAASGNLVHAVWMDNAEGVIYYARSANSGQTWSTQVALPTGGNQCFYPSVAASGSAVHIMFLRIVPPGFDVRYVRSLDCGQTLANDILLGISLTAQNDTTAITASGNNVYATWGSRVGDMGGIFNYRQSGDGGATWFNEQTLVDGVMRNIHPYICLASQGSLLYAVWGDMRAGITNEHVFYRQYPALPEAVTGSVSTNLGWVNFSVNNGYITNLNLVRPSDITCAVAGYIFPYGMFSFNIEDLIEGQPAIVTIRFPNPLPAGCKYYKCQNGNVIDCSSLVTRSDTNTIVLTLQDGGKGDADGVVNGTIVDPGGPAFPLGTPQSSSAQMPTSTPQKPVSLSNITVKSASLSATKVTPGTPVTVTANVANTGTGNGTSVVKVYVNGAEEASQGVAVNSGSSLQVNFNVSRNEPGTYSVYVGGVQAGSFVVDDLAGSNILIFTSLAMIGLALITGAIFFTRRRQGAC